MKYHISLTIVDIWYPNLLFFLFTFLLMFDQLCLIGIGVRPSWLDFNEEQQTLNLVLFFFAICCVWLIQGESEKSQLCVISILNCLYHVPVHKTVCSHGKCSKFFVLQKCCLAQRWCELWTSCEMHITIFRQVNDFVFESLFP